MKKILIAAACASLALPAMATTVHNADATRQGSELFRFMPKARAEREQAGIGDLTRFNSPKNNRNAIKGDASFKVGSFKSLELNALPAASLVGFLDGPKGETWYYTGNYIYTNNQVSGFEFNIYDASFKKVGTVRDNVELQENETRVASVTIGPAVTQKFFNYDNNYEIMIDVSTNTTDYVNNYRTRVYAVANLADDAMSECLHTIKGYYVSAIDTAQDSWSENYYITFMTEEDTETPMVGNVLNTVDYHYVTYKKAGYSGDMVSVLDTRVPVVALAGADAIPFLVTQKDGIPYFSVNRLKYSWYLDPFDYTVETPTPDNELIVDIYSMESSSASEAKHYSTTRIPLGATEDNLFFLYVGSFMYNDDVDMSRNDDGTPLLYVTRAHPQQGGDEFYYDYEAYDGAAKGEDALATKRYDIGVGVDGGYFMNDINGFDPQVMFITQSTGTYGFSFVNILDGSVEHTIPFGFNEGSTVHTMNATANRIPAGDSYVYVVPQTRGFSDASGDCHVNVVFASPDGDIVKVDDINMGQNIDYAQVYSGVEAYDPYLFNLDADREYMVLMKRRDNATSTDHEEFAVISANPEKGSLVTLGPDEEKGTLVTISLLNIGNENAKLAAIYVNQIPGNWQYTTTYFDLPLTLFEAGDGTIANPYEISTVGGLRQIKSAPNAYFAVVADIDADGSVISNPDFNFTGALDGRGHVISNLTLAGRALLPQVSGEVPESDEDGNLSDVDVTKGVVKNLKFYNAKLNATVDAHALVVGRLSGGKVNNVHAYKSSVVSTEDVAGIVGRAVSFSEVSNCSFDGKIVSPENSVGGILGSTATGSSVFSCAFTGSIEGGSSVGGILGSVGSYGNGVKDCHVNADITGKNTIGGIVGVTGNVPFTNNYVEGTITATENLRWGGGAKVGGIAGSHSNFYSEEEGVEVQPLIFKNFINLTSITAPEAPAGAYPAENATVHRVVGYTRANYADEVDYDDDYEPIYGEPLSADLSIRDNYVISTLPVVDSTVADDSGSTEGKSTDASELGKDFFADPLGFSFGETAAAPWAMADDALTPRLYFENGLMMVNPANVSLRVDEEAEIAVTICGVELSAAVIGDIVLEYDDTLVEISDNSMTEDGLLLTVMGIAEGECDLVVKFNGQSVKSHIVVLPLTGVDNVVASETALTFDGSAIHAEGAAIEIFDISGVKVLAGNDAVATDRLSAGIYIAVATDAAGTNTLKFRVK